MSHTRLPKLSEAAVLRGVLAEARHLGVILRRQNTGAARNRSGRLVRYGVRGASDLIGQTGPTWGDLAGLVVAIECKREDWRIPRPPRPGKLPGEARQHWERQLARLREVNECGGFGFWTDHPQHARGVLEALRTGRYRIEIGADEEVTLVAL